MKTLTYEKNRKCQNLQNYAKGNLLCWKYGFSGTKSFFKNQKGDSQEIKK